jgi:hypothetical protein
MKVVSPNGGLSRGQRYGRTLLAERLGRKREASEG